MQRYGFFIVTIQWIKFLIAVCIRKRKKEKKRKEKVKVKGNNLPFMSFRKVWKVFGCLRARWNSLPCFYWIHCWGSVWESKMCLMACVFSAFQIHFNAVTMNQHVFLLFILNVLLSFSWAISAKLHDNNNNNNKSSEKLNNHINHNMENTVIYIVWQCCLFYNANMRISIFIILIKNSHLMIISLEHTSICLFCVWFDVFFSYISILIIL